MSFEKWHKYKLGDLVDNQRGISYGIVQPGTFQKSGVPIVKVNNLTERKIAFEDLDKVSQEIESKYQRTRLKGNEILISLVGTLGHVHLVDDSMIGWNVARAIGVIPIDEKFDKNWVFWFLKSPNFQETIRNVASTSVQATLNLKELNEIEVLYPPHEKERLRILNILTALDDKIELNRRMNETLEGIAQAVWGEWFGKYASGEEELPEGWRWGNILEIANLIGGGTPKTEIEEYWNGEIGWISGKDITPNNRSIIIEPEKKITKKGLENSSAKLLPSLSTVISARGTVGNFCLIPTEMTISQSNYALKSIFENTDFFLFQLVANLVSEMQQKSYGTVFDTITTKTFSEIEIPIPSVSKMVEYDEAMRPVFEKRIENLQQSRTLTALRDALLPRLMRGENTIFL